MMTSEELLDECADTLADLFHLHVERLQVKLDKADHSEFLQGYAGQLFYLGGVALVLASITKNGPTGAEMVCILGQAISGISEAYEDLRKATTRGDNGEGPKLSEVPTPPQ